jgi:predicted ATPase
VEHPGRVIARQEFAQHVWAEAHVSQSVLRVCIWELRQALGESGGTPHYIETVGQQGYRFRAPVQSPGAAAPQTAPFVGRQAELSALQSALEQAQRGRLQLVFVTGDPGIGKTTLVRQFLAQVPTPLPLWRGTGQCVEHVGSGEAYLPWLEALGRLGRDTGCEPLVEVLRRTAPMWLAHLPLLVEPEEQERLHRQTQGLPSERMLRQLVEALTVITRERLVVLVLEDLQWSDHATVEVLSYLARRPDPVRLLVLGTYRPAEVIARGHPLRQTVQELVAHQLGQELRLELLTEAQVQTYVTQRLGTSPASTEMGALLYRRTDGNALFVVQLFDHLLHQGFLVEAAGQWRLRDGVAAVEREVPEGLRALLLKQVETLGDAAQQVLDAASVSGLHFTPAEVAAMLQGAVEDVEALCDALTRQGACIVAQDFLTWPDGTATVRYGFRHVLYREVLYERLGLAQRSRWHRLVGERLETGYGSQAREQAGALALHFERGQDAQRAVQYRQYAAEQALSRSAYIEVLVHCHKGLNLLATLPENSERTTQELGLRLALNTALTATQGYTAEALVQNLRHTLALCEAVAATTDLVPVLDGLTRLCMMRGDRTATEQLMAREQALLSQLHDVASLLQLHTMLGTAETFRGAYAQAEAHLQYVLHSYDAEAHRSLTLLGRDAIVSTLSMSGWRLWLTGWPDQAAEQVVRARAHAEALAHPFSLVGALIYVTLVRQGRGELRAAAAASHHLTTLGREQGFVYYEVVGTMLQGSVWVQGGEPAHGLALLTPGLAQYRRLGSLASLPLYLTFLAEAYLHQGQVEEGLSVIEEAIQLTKTHFARFWTPEVYRMKGELLLAQARQGHTAIGPETIAAEACFQQALAIAQQQGAKALELWAATSLSRLWLAQAQPEAAQGLLAELCCGFIEGLDTVDLQAAQDLLARCYSVA